MSIKTPRLIRDRCGVYYFRLIVPLPLRDTIGAMNDYLNSPAPKSANERQNALRLANKLRAHMAHVRDLINAHTAAVTLVGAAQATGAANPPQGAKPLGL